MRLNYKSVVIALLSCLSAACGGQTGQTDRTSEESASQHTVMMEKGSHPRHLNVNKSRLMRHVTCTPESVNSMQHAADSIYAVGRALCLDSLWFCNEDYNKELKGKYGDTLATVTFILLSHDAIKEVACDEANAAFVWHEVARTMMKEFLSKNKGSVTEKGYERIMKVAEEAIYRYACGSQAEMNNVAWRDVALSSYRLAELYEQVMDTWPGHESLTLAHNDYNHITETLYRYRSTITGYYSMLPLQIGILCKDIMDGKAKSLKSVLTGARNERGDEESAITNLREHRFLDDKGKETCLTDEVVTRMAEESYVN